MKIKILVLFTFLSVLLGGAAGSYIALTHATPSIEELRQFKSLSGTKIYSDDDTLIGELKIEKGIFVPVEKIPKDLINAIIAVEDSRFWKHKGIDYFAISRALLKDIIHGSLKEGGSTITQQLAKVVFLSPKKTIRRKLLEASLALKIEKNLTKKEILELYLNKVYFGHGAYGVEMASRTYFGKSVQDLNLAEASMIASLVKAPTYYSPYNDLAKAKTRQQVVLSRMVEEGYISQSQKKMASGQPLYLSSRRKGMEAYSYFLEYIRKYLEDRYGADTVYKAGLRVHTTLDREMQISAVNAIRSGLRDIDKRRGWRGPVEHKSGIDVEKELRTNELSTPVVVNPGDVHSGLVLKVSDKEAVVKTRGVVGKLPLSEARWASRVLDPQKDSAKTLKNFTLSKILTPGDVIKVSIKRIQKNKVSLALEQEPEIEGALVAVEPNTGFIRAMVGGYDFIKSGFNRALYAERQPGSAFKPVIYAAAMDNGYTPASVINDEPVTYMGGPDGEWTPENYDHKYYGLTRLREALVYSRNVVTVKLVESMGIDTLRTYAKLAGYSGEMPRNLSIALGSFNVTPIELASIYNVFASGGMRIKPAGVKYITDAKGRVVESNEPAPEQAISPQTAFLVTSMMEDVVQQGTGWRARALGFPVAGKTGTTNEYKDAWFVGYSSSLVACVWVGYDNFRTLGPRETGARAASPVWVEFMNNAVKGKAEPFAQPEGIVSYFIDPKTGLLSPEDSGIREYFREGTEPRQYAPYKSIWEVRDPSRFNFD
jgi:penicillin-binding protein 1A